MQATQSTDAQGKRTFPSPFTAPIQAARRLMERQRQEGEAADDLSGAGRLSDAERAEGLTGALRGQRRYDEAAIVASLDAGLELAEAADFGAPDEPAPGRPSEPHGKSPFVSLNLDLHGSRGPDLQWDRGPDPSAVRAAISRLARESRNKEAIGAQDATAFANAVAFEEVARRVWGEGRVEAPAPLTHEIAGNQAAGADHGAPAAEVYVTTEALAPAASAFFSAPLKDASLFADSSSSNDAGAGCVPPGSVDALAPFESVPERAPESAQAESASLEKAATQGFDTTAMQAGAPQVGASESEGGECLAHDAGNLLSAMRLYSELLCISGVLQDRHRHYADDLKLLAARSQKLIDRLVKLGERLSEAQALVLKGDYAAAPASAEFEGEAPPLAQDWVGLLGTPSIAAAASTAGVRQGAGPGPNVLEAELETGMPQPELNAEDSGCAPALTFAAGGMQSTGEANHTSVEIAGFATADAPGSELWEGTDLAAALRRLGNLLQTVSHGALTIDLGPEAALPVEIGLEPLERILVNLVCNATAAVQESGSIRIRAGVRFAGTKEEGEDGEDGVGRPQTATTVLTVDDSGCGMDPAQVRRALGERDEDNLTGHSAGRRGLGLRIVRELVAASGGKLFLHSQPGVGTRTEIHWPAPTPVSGLADSSSLQAQRSFGPAVPRKPVGVSGVAAPGSSGPRTGSARTSVARTTVARIRAGSVTGEEGAVAC